MMCIKAKHSHIIVIITSGAIVPHMDSTQTAQKGWLKLLIAAPPDISDDSLLLLISLLFSGWSHWWGEAAMPRGKNYTPSLLPACLLTEDPALGVAPADTTASMTGGWSAQSVGNPVLPPRLSYRRVLLLTPVLCHLRGPQISCRLVPLSPLHTNSFSLSLLVSLSLSLRGLLTHTVVCSHRTRYCRYAARSERRDDLSFSTACISRRTVLSWLRGAPRPLRSPPRVGEPRFNSVDLNKIYLHPTTRLVNTRKNKLFNFWSPRCILTLNPIPKLLHISHKTNRGVTKGRISGALLWQCHTCSSVFDLAWLCGHHGAGVWTLFQLPFAERSRQTSLPFSSCFISLPRPTNGCREIQKNTNKTLPRH